MTNYKKQGKANRRKGITFENFICKKLRPFFPKIGRKLEAREGSVDIENSGCYAIQCKNTQKYVPLSEFEKIPDTPYVKMIEGTGVEKWARPLLICKAKRKKTLVTMELDTFIDLL